MLSVASQRAPGRLRGRGRCAGTRCGTAWGGPGRGGGRRRGRFRPDRRQDRPSRGTSRIPCRETRTRRAQAPRRGARPSSRKGCTRLGSWCRRCRRPRGPTMRPAHGRPRCAPPLRGSLCVSPRCARAVVPSCLTFISSPVTLRVTLHVTKGGVMLVIVQHTLIDPPTAFIRGERLKRAEGAPEGARVLQFLPSHDGTLVTCLWEDRKSTRLNSSHLGIS